MNKYISWESKMIRNTIDGKSYQVDFKVDGGLIFVKITGFKKTSPYHLSGYASSGEINRIVGLLASEIFQHPAENESLN